MVDTRLHYGNALVTHETLYYKTFWCFFSWCLWSEDPYWKKWRLNVTYTCLLIHKSDGYFMFFVFVIFCGLYLYLWMEKSLTCLHYKAHPNFPKGRSTGRATHATSCSCHGGKRALSTPQHACSTALATTTGLETDAPAISAGSYKLTQGPVVWIVHAFLRHDSGMHS